MKIRYFFLCCTDRLLLPHIYRNGRKAVRNVLHIRRGCFRNVLFSGRRIHIHRRRCFCGSFLRNERFGFLYSCFCDFCLDRCFRPKQLAAVVAAHVAELDTETCVFQRHVERMLLCGTEKFPTGDILPALFGGKAGGWNRIVLAEINLRFDNCQLVADAQRLQEHSPVRAGQTEPEPLIAEIQLPDRMPGFDGDRFAQEFHRVKARHLAQLLHGGVVHHSGFVVIHFLELLP